MNSHNFSAHDAEAQLKALLFSGKKDSTSSSGTASPASLAMGNLQYHLLETISLGVQSHYNLLTIITLLKK